MKLDIGMLTHDLAITVPQLLWVVDLVCRLVVSVHVTGVTAYMLDAGIPPFLRALSSFHGWLPFGLLWLLSRLGYDRRAFRLQSVAAIIVLLVSYLFAPAPPPSTSHPAWAVNLNYVYGLDDKHPQTYMAPRLWLGFMMAFHVFAIYLPTHTGIASSTPTASACTEASLPASPQIISLWSLAFA